MKEALVIKRTILEKSSFWKKFNERDGVIHSVVSLSQEEARDFVDFVKQNGEFLPRYGPSGIEEDPTWQQIATYNVFKRNNKFFFYTRNPNRNAEDGGREIRLDNKISCGVGGHIDPYDDDLLHAVVREIDEEVNVVQNGIEVKISNVEIIGLIKSDKTAVSQVHLGLLTLVKLDENANVEPNDLEIFEPFFATIDEIKSRVSKNEIVLEDWTSLSLELLN